MSLIIIGVLQQIDLDVIQCEAFAASKPIKGLEEGILLMCFSDLRQLLDLFMAWDWATYLGKKYAIKNSTVNFHFTNKKSYIVVFFVKTICFHETTGSNITPIT